MSRRKPRLPDELPRQATGVTLAREWLRVHVPTATVYESCYLGPLTTPAALGDLSPAELRMCSTHRPRVQHVAILPTELLLVEGREKLERDRVLRLVDFRGLVPETPELAAVAGLPVRAVLVVRYAGDAALAMARRFGVEVAVPVWGFTMPPPGELHVVAAGASGDGARERPSPGVAGTGTKRRAGRRPPCGKRTSEH
jgi:hypothetical protein